jgi:hypothetical protein
MNTAPLFERTWKDLDVALPAQVSVGSVIEKREDGFYLFLWVKRAYVIIPGQRGRGCHIELDEKSDTMVYGPVDNLLWLSRSRIELEAAAKKHFKKMMYEYVDFRRPVVIHIDQEKDVV